MDNKSIANLGRFKDIVVTLLSYGFEDLAERLDLPGKVRFGKIHNMDLELGTHERIRRALEDVFTVFDEWPLAAASLSQVHRAVLREGGLRLPSNLAMMVKALITAEGTARLLYPELKIIEEVEVPVKRLAAKRFRPRIMWRSFPATLSQFLAFHGQLPRRFAQIVEKIDQGELSIRFEHGNLEGFRNTLENIFDRLTFGIIIAAMIIGSSMIVMTGVGPFLFGLPALGVIGYLISGFLSLWLVINIIRTHSK